MMNYLQEIKAAVLMFLLSLEAFAQVSFQARYTTGSDDDASYVQQTADSGYIIVGTTWINGFGNADIFLMHVNDTGSVEWAKKYGNPFSTAMDQGWFVSQTTDGGYILGGKVPGPNFGTSYGLALKVDNAGNIQWEKEFIGTGSWVDIRYAHETTDGGYFIAGTQNDSLGIVGVKLDNAGNVQWSYTYGETANAMYGADATDDGGFVLVGSTGGIFSTTNDFYVIKMDSLGAIEWSKKYGSPGDDASGSIRQTADGGYIIAGNSDSLSLAGNHDFLIIKTDNMGNVQWSKVFGEAAKDYNPTIWQTPDGGYAFLGESYSFGSEQPLFVKIDNAGNLQWTRFFYGVSHAESPVLGLTYDGGFIITSDQLNNAEVYLVKTDASGLSGCYDSTVVIQEGVVTVDTSSGAIQGTGLSDTVIGLNVSTINYAENILCLQNIPPPPLASFSSSSNSICAGDCITFTDLSSNAPTAWQWSFPGGAPSSSTVQNPGPVCYNNAGSYDVTLIVSNQYGSDTLLQSLFIQVDSLPVASISQDTAICQGDSVVLTASGGSAFSWNTGDTTASIAVSPSTSALFWVIVSNGNCTDSASVNVTVVPLPNANIAGNTVLCTGDSTTLLASGGTSYLWNTGDTVNAITVSPNNSTTYSVTVSNGSCSDTASVTVNVNSAPIASIAADTSICEGDQVSITASGGAAYDWSTGDTTASITVSPVITTVYYVTVSTGSCTDTASMTVTVIPYPIISATPDTAICAGDTVVLSLSGGNAYSWSTGATSSSISVSPSSTATYVYTVTNNGLCGITDSITVTVLPPLNATVTGDATVCAGSVAHITANGGNTYMWNTGETTASIAPLITSSSAFMVTVSNACGSDVASFFVDMLPAPSVVAEQDTSIMIGESVQISASGGTQYYWSPSNGLSCTDCPDPIAAPITTTTYYVTVTDDNGCTAMDSLTITVTDLLCGDLFVPNIFSPNNDGHNDVLYVYGNCIVSMEFFIYDRWGEKVFETSDPAMGWDGKFRNRDVNTGVFVYYLKATEKTGKTVDIKGSITLIR